MLPPFIIDQIRKREEQERRDDRPRVELPLPFSGPAVEQRADEEADRGLVIIDLGA